MVVADRRLALRALVEVVVRLGNVAPAGEQGGELAKRDGHASLPFGVELRGHGVRTRREVDLPGVPSRSTDASGRKRPCSVR